MTKEQIYEFGYEIWCGVKDLERGESDIAKMFPSFVKKFFLFLATPYFVCDYIKMFFAIYLRTRKDIFGKLNLHVHFYELYLKERGWISD